MATNLPAAITADAALIRHMLDTGGVVDVTVRSLKTGHHVTLTFACKAKGPDGKYLKRTTTAGRVGLGKADKVDVTETHGEWPACKVGAYMTGSKKFYSDTNDTARAWTAEAVMGAVYGLRAFPASAEVKVATRCCMCRHKLTDPTSIDRMIGPECAGKATGSQVAPKAHKAVQSELTEEAVEGLEAAFGNIATVAAEGYAEMNGNAPAFADVYEAMMDALGDVDKLDTFCGEHALPLALRTFLFANMKVAA